MQSFSKDTLFNDLPADIKQKIINIRSLSSSQPQPFVPVPLKEFKYISVPSSKGFSADFASLCNIKLNHENVEEELKTEITEFNNFVSTYRLNINNTDFVTELEKTIGLMEAKFKKRLDFLNKMEL